jgi:hypothetical protein
MTEETKSAWRGLRVFAQLTLGVYAVVAWVNWVVRDEDSWPWTLAGGRLLLASLFVVAGCTIIALYFQDDD